MAPVDDDEDWDAVIARAKMQAASPRAPRALPPFPARFASPQTPPPSLTRQALAARRPAEEDLVTPPPLDRAPRSESREEAKAKLAALVAWGSMKRPSAPQQAFVARRSAEEGLVTPPPLAPLKISRVRLR
jgi:hypothetical protein